MRTSGDKPKRLAPWIRSSDRQGVGSEALQAGRKAKGYAIHPSVWKVNSANFACRGFSEIRPLAALVVTVVALYNAAGLMNPASLWGG
jgi:hypothetical protein